MTDRQTNRQTDFQLVDSIPFCRMGSSENGYLMAIDLGQLILYFPPVSKTDLALVIHLENSLPSDGNFPGRSPLLLPELALGALVAEHLHLAICPVDQIVLPVTRVLRVAVDL